MSYYEYLIWHVLTCSLKPNSLYVQLILLIDIKSDYDSESKPSN